jgi:hypothetical protein
MARKNASTVEALTHEEAKRKNVPTAEYRSVMQKNEIAPVRVAYPRSAAGLDEEKQRRNRDPDPRLFWRSNDEQDWSGDLGQRIIQQPFSRKSLGVDIRGHARTLHINDRTSRQIRMQADRLLAPEVANVDGNTEERRGKVFVFNGPPPVLQTFTDADAEIAAAGAWIAARNAERIAPHEIGVFVRSDA